LGTFEDTIKFFYNLSSKCSAYPFGNHREFLGVLCGLKASVVFKKIVKIPVPPDG